MWTGATSGQQAIFLELGVSTLHSWCGEGKIIWVRPLMALSLGVFLGITSPKCLSSMHFLTVQGGPPPGFSWALASRKQQTFWSRTEFGIAVRQPGAPTRSLVHPHWSQILGQIQGARMLCPVAGGLPICQPAAICKCQNCSSLPAVFLEWSLSTLPYW